MLALCFLLSAAVLGCDPSAQVYAEAASRVPPEHWALVANVKIWDDPDARSCSAVFEPGDTPACEGIPNGLILPRRRTDWMLLHEVAHHVLYAHPELLDSWREMFWPDGHARWQPPTRYARTEPDEDFAESYRRMIEGELEAASPARYVWFRQALPMVVPR